MKKMLGFTLCFCFLFSSYAAEQKNEKPPTLSAEVEMSKYVPANECYVLFLLEASGENMLAAKTLFDRKLNEFSDKLKKDFPQVKLEVTPINIGTKNFMFWRPTENPFSPDIAKILICVLPADESMAVKLMDFGIQLGLLPFCGTSREGSFGAVFYGLKDPEKEIDSLYAPASQKLQKEASKLAGMLHRSVVKMEDVSRFVSHQEGYELRSGEMKINLPSDFCSSDMNRIKVSLVLRANFEVAEKSSGEK